MGMQLTAIGYCYSQKVHGMEKKTAAFVLATLDAVSMFIFWIMLVYLNQWQEEAADQQNEDVCSADDYSVIIEGLPPAGNEEAHKKLEADLRNHFKRILPPRDFVTTDEEKKNKIDVERDIDVFDINFAYTAVGAKLAALHERGKVARRLDKLRMQVKIHEETITHLPKGESCTSKALKKKMDTQLHLLEGKFADLQEKIDAL